MLKEAPPEFKSSSTVQKPTPIAVKQHRSLLTSPSNPERRRRRALELSHRKQTLLGETPRYTTRYVPHLLHPHT